MNDMIYDVIKFIAEQKGISIRSLENKLGFANGTLQRWGKTTDPKLSKAYSVAKELNIPIDYLMYGKIVNGNLVINKLIKPKRKDFYSDR